LQLTLKPSPGPSHNGAQATFGTPAGATTGMGGIATTTGADLAIVVVMAIMVGMAAIMVGMAAIMVLVDAAIMVDLAVIADHL
jgi:hypothetical protein